MIFSQQVFWLIFSVFILGAVVFDLYFWGRHKHEFSLKEAGLWTLIWIGLSLFFNLLIYLYMGQVKALEYLTAYVLEKSLSLDNLFVFLIIFSYFDLPLNSQRKVLKLGILGAFVLRAVFIFGGIWLLGEFDFLFYIFGAFLIYSGIKLIFQKSERRVDPQKSFFIRLVRKIAPFDDACKVDFFSKNTGKLCLTPLFITLLLIEGSDLVFALDSVPAVLAISRDPFIAYTSNAFAILGLRAFYFFLVGFLPKFVYLKTGVMILLIFIGLKMILSQHFHIPIYFSLIFILMTLFLAALFSILKNRKT
ncbi:MAG: TerC/Alx family metal homeostasis membrane protein [bacterium]|nr:TerC/Alx family metal homeostasis membrane protein [bacterium]